MRGRKTGNLLLVGVMKSKPVHHIEIVGNSRPRLHHIAFSKMSLTRSDPGTIARFWFPSPNAKIVGTHWVLRMLTLGVIHHGGLTCRLTRY